jgi:hypothetical protein
MKVSELRQALQAADPAAVLASPRILERVVQQVYRLPNVLLRVPHRECFVVDRQVLFRHVEQDDLDLEPDQLLPATVILLARPSVEELGNLDRPQLLTKYWRLLFHANVHLALEGRIAEGRLALDGIRERIAAIGRAEFEEVRSVLVQDGCLLPAADEKAVYVEFAAVYLELRYFAANLLPTYFPGIQDFKPIDQLLARDLDGDALFAHSRLAGAPDPVLLTDTSGDEAHDYYWRLMRSAERAGRAGNTVRAGILRTKAARVAPAALAAGTRAEAEADIQSLAKRLQAALQLSDADTAEWAKALTPLLDKADQGNNPVEAVLLSDLQKVALDNERNIYEISLVEWLLSVGKRPIRRPLPSQRVVRITSHVRNALQRLTMARLADADRQHLARLLQEALQASEERLRARFRPILVGAFHDVGLEPTNAPERVAFAKIVEELLDRISANGFCTFSDLRDALARNQLKLPDLADPQDFVRGDQLLRLDRRMAALLDGVYRPSELYSRLLERLTALNFGTTAGRLLTRFVTLPFGGAFVLLEGTKHLLSMVGIQIAFGSVKQTVAEGTEQIAGKVEPSPLELPWFVWWLTFFLLGFFLLGLMQAEGFRRPIVAACKLFFRGLHAVFIDFPLYLGRVAWLRQMVESWPFQLFYWFLVKPLVACGLVYLWLPQTFETWPGEISVFVAAMLLINSRVGRAAAEAVVQGTANLYHLFRAGLLQGLFRLIVYVFKRVTDAVELVLFTVDEWLRFRSGEGRFALAVRAVLGAIWFPISYVARFYIVVLIEPGFNPIKAPISILAAKIIYPLYLWPASTLLAHWLTPIFGTYVGWGLAWSTVWLSPDLFGYLFWEMTRNWRLYRANRSPAVKPIAIGPHGETLKALLRPGFHSGTVPKLYARLRRAERDALQTGSWRAARTCRHSLEEIQRAVKLFAERNLAPLLEQSAPWRGRRLGVGRVTLASNRIGLELTHPEFPEKPVWLEFEERAGWLVAGFRETGWLEQLSLEQRPAWTSALSVFYRLSSVDLIHEQVRANLPPGVTDFDLNPRGLVLYPAGRSGRALVYDLHNPRDPLLPRTLAGAPAPNGPALHPRQILFAEVLMSWQQWVDRWQPGPDGNERPRLIDGAGVESVLLKAVSRPQPN